MTAEAAVLSDLIGTIYDTTLDRALWSEVLQKSAAFVGGSAASLFWKDTVRGTGKPFLYWIARHDTTVPSYFDQCVRVDPLTTRQFMFDVGEVYSVEDCMPYAEFMESRLYKEWIKPNGYVEQLAATVDKSTTGFLLFAIFRGEEQGFVDAEARRRMRLIIPHVRRAVLIGNVLDFGMAEATAFKDTLNGLAAGVFLVDEGARIVFANASGQALLDEGKILCRKNGVLTAADPRIRKMLPGVIASAGDGDAAVGTNGIAVPLSPHPGQAPHPGQPWLAHILPLTFGARRHAGIEYSAVAAVFVHQASLETPSSMETLSKLYKLTPSELRVLAAVSDVGGVSAVAEVVGVAEATVKTHLQHLFAKTGTNRQTDLVKLVAAHASPLRQIP
jgi:DNA-binding CsgD family transcriptional regulator/PAS domain-containing protein